VSALAFTPSLFTLQWTQTVYNGHELS